MLSALSLTGEQIRAARALGRLEQADLARRSGLSLETIKRLERIRGPVDANSRTLKAIAQAFRQIGIAFVAGENAGVKFDRPSTKAETSHPPASPVSPEDTAGQVHRLIFHSVIDPALADRVKATLDQIMASAEERNRGLGVTGALYAHGGHFLQVIEGPKHAVLQVYGAISADPRHRDLQIIESRAVPARHFEGWTVCCGRFRTDDSFFDADSSEEDLGFLAGLRKPVPAIGLLSIISDLQHLAPRNARTAGPCPLAGDCGDRVCADNAGIEVRRVA